MKFDEYLKANGLSRKAFGDQIGVERSIVARWALGDRQPPLAMVALIEKKTGGAVRLEDWIDEPAKGSANKTPSDAHGSRPPSAKARRTSRDYGRPASTGSGRPVFHGSSET